ncbi:TetR/AcrR family transcriptional regulator [Paraburkholderia caffeinilytica]|uniref:TetR/AcrR family transcriptional regulator n=1 Tax=Paraburkholderia caffeinilytica TaxID=1761016 RepID=UPI0038BC4332
MQEETSPGRAGRSARSLSARKMPHQSRGRETIETILKAAAIQIEKGGLDGLTTRRIAQEAGVSVGALYEYFPNKESIILALAQRWMSQIYEVTEAVHPRHGATHDLLTYLNKSIDCIVPLYRDQPGLSAINTMLTSAPDLRAAAEEHRRRFVELVVDSISMLLPNAAVADIAVLARTLQIIGHGMISEAYVRDAPHPEKFMESLKVCLFALAARLMLAPGCP